MGALGGCSLWDNWFGESKTPLPGKREPIAPGQGSLKADPEVPKVVLPPPVRNAAWPQAGGNPSHLMGHLAAGDRLAEAWTAISARAAATGKIMLAQPGGRRTASVFTMDSDAVVSAFQLATGARLWRFDTQAEDDRQHQCRRRPGGRSAARCMRSTAWPSWWRSMPRPAR